MKKTVVIFQPRLLHYRTELFEQLREACAADGIELRLVCGQAVGRERSKQDEAELPWVEKVENRYLEIAGRTILWQPTPFDWRECDLAIVMQESRILSNYPMQALRKLRGSKVAYWGHGKNFFEKSFGTVTDWWKDWLIRRVDWWFAYTDIVVDIVTGSGFPADRITCLNNAIDNSGFKKELASVTDGDLEHARAQLDIPQGAPVGIFCGSLYPEKKLDFLVESADEVQRQMPEFRLILIGSGPSASIIEEASKSRPWLHAVGQKRGKEKAVYFRLADFMLNPGTVGLHILDAFCAGIIMVTTIGANHSPEIAYLRQGENGVMVEPKPEAYAGEILSLIADPERAASMKKAALADSEIYTLPNMVENFREGIRRALAV